MFHDWNVCVLSCRRGDRYMKEWGELKHGDRKSIICALLGWLPHRSVVLRPTGDLGRAMMNAHKSRSPRLVFICFFTSSWCHRTKTPHFRADPMSLINSFLGTNDRWGSRVESYPGLFRWDAHTAAQGHRAQRILSWDAHTAARGHRGKWKWKKPTKAIKELGLQRALSAVQCNCWDRTACQVCTAL